MFTPEFRNRLDAMISFAALPKEVILQVVEKFVLQLEAQLMDRNVQIELTPEAAEWLADKGYDDKMGARPLGRVIQEHIKKPLAEELLFGKLAKGGLVQVMVRDGEIALQDRAGRGRRGSPRRSRRCSPPNSPRLPRETSENPAGPAGGVFSWAAGVERVEEGAAAVDDEDLAGDVGGAGEARKRADLAKSAGWRRGRGG